MIYIYLENKSDVISVEKEKALPAMVSQVLEVFHKLNSIENAVLGLIADDYLEIKITSVNKFLWQAEFINLKNGEIKKEYYSSRKITEIIKDIFKGNSLEKR